MDYHVPGSDIIIKIAERGPRLPPHGTRLSLTNAIQDIVQHIPPTDPLRTMGQDGTTGYVYPTNWRPGSPLSPVRVIALFPRQVRWSWARDVLRGVRDIMTTQSSLGGIGTIECEFHFLTEYSGILGRGFVGNHLGSEVNGTEVAEWGVS